MAERISDASALVSWRKSSYSNGQGAECVEVADGYPGAVPIRDSKNPDGPALVFPTPAWSSFVTAVQSGEPPLNP
ncbi:DUF397 domain-containing protein [Streptomyces sp. B1866]|uniref:DUF397 domain-containing protein n=1 Tax=Streptomyces sp. B1866 TaxID=3075431 RepID=UPI00288F52DA|nr:DUF397 domain-containing protein [Streptomyces sp. B1866]MDT3396099.1 DUF397 domain-containing protein [Streptomyces sp. B1866]